MNTLYIRDEETYKPAEPAEILEEAGRLVAELQPTEEPTRPNEHSGLREFLRLRLGPLEYEVFAIVVLDSNDRITEYAELFRGSISECSIYPREVLREAMRRNAAAVILVHNHPSGTAEPSSLDRMMTRRVKDALALLDIGIRDHLVVGEQRIVSFAERGWI